MVPRAAWLAVGALVAALLVRHLPGPAWAILLAVTLVVAARPSARVPAVGLACGFLLVLARVAIVAAFAAPVVTVPLTDGPRDWRGEVVSLGTTADGIQRAFLDVSLTGGPAQGTSGTLRVYAQLPRYPEVVPGDIITFRGALEPVEPGAGFADYLARNGATATCRIRAFGPEIGDSGASSPLEHMRRDAGDLLGRVLPSDEAGLAAGMLIGLRDRVDREVATAFTASGLSHVVAISGWNIALVGALIAACLRRLPRRPRSALIIIAIVVYTIAAGASASVVRAAVMGAIVLLARESGRRGAASAALALATAGLTITEPSMVDDAGFRLSVAATAGLLAWGSPLTAALRARAPRRVPEWLLESLGVSLAAQAATLPLVLMDFGRLSLVAPAANLVVAPLVAPAMLAGAVALLAGGLVAIGAPPLLGMVAATGGWAALGSIIAVARLAASLPFASIEVGAPWNLAGALLAALVLVVFGTARGRRSVRGAHVRLALARRGPRPPAQGHRRSADAAAPHRAGPGGLTQSGSAHRQEDAAGRAVARRLTLGAVAGLAAVIVLASLVLAARPNGRLRITVLDVGQGDAVLLDGPRGGRILVDSGPDPDRLVARLDERIPPWDRRLDLVILTHPHEDHVAGLALLLERYGVRAVAENGMLGNGPGDAAYRRELERTGRRSTVLAAGDSVALDGIPLAVLWPPRGSLPARAPNSGKAINDSSLVLDIHFGERRFLLTGDVEEEVDPLLLGAGIGEPDGQRLDFLKVPHHGSGTATSDGLVAALRPRIAAVSVGAKNDYGHPSPKTIARLQAAIDHVLRTDTDGSIEVSSDGRDLRLTGGTTRIVYVPPAPGGAGVAAVPRIATWPSRAVARRSTCCAHSARPAGSSLTVSPSRRSPPTLHAASLSTGSRSTATLSKPQRSSTTSTSCSRRTTRCASSGTAGPAPGGSSGMGMKSSPARSPPIRSRDSAISRPTGGGPHLRPARVGSWPMRTSAATGDSFRWRIGWTTWSDGTPSTLRRCARRGRGPNASNARCAGRPAANLMTSDACRGWRPPGAATGPPPHTKRLHDRLAAARLLVGRGRICHGPGGASDGARAR